MKRTLLILAALAGQLWGAHAPVLSAMTGSQATFRYNRPDTTVCVWEVSTSATYAPLIPDLLTQNDSGALYTRWWVLGQNTALTASTTYYWRQTCGAEVYTGQFTTLAALTSPPNQWNYSSGGGGILANKMRLDYGPTPALGSSTTVACTPQCTVVLDYPTDSVIFYQTTYLNESDQVAQGSLQVSGR